MFLLGLSKVEYLRSHVFIFFLNCNKFSLKFGVHYVDFTDPERPRTPKASAAYLKEIISNNGFVENPACPY